MNNKSYIRKTAFAWIASVLTVIISGLSSCDYLNIDKYTTEDLKMDSIFSSTRYIEAHMWGAAARFHDEGAILGNNYTPGPLATDEAFCLFETSEFRGMAFVQGEVNADNLRGLNNWGTWYQIIRQCNTIFARIDEARDMTTFDRNRILGNTRFIRAYAYYNLLMNYGPVVLLGDEVVPNNEDVSYYDRPRDLYDDCVEYICNEFEEAANYLPKRANSLVDFGLPTQGAAYGLVARLRLQHASELYNGGRSARVFFGTWTRKVDKKHFIQQQHDPRRWAVAAAAAKRVIDLEDFGNKLYSLHWVRKNTLTRPLPTYTDDPDFNKPWPTESNAPFVLGEFGAESIDPFLSYNDLFNGETPMNVNPEVIWGRISPSTTQYLRHSAPWSSSGYNGMGVTQKIIDAYLMHDGRTYLEANVDETEFVAIDPTNRNISSEYWLASTGVNSMYFNREARFYASIGFSECVWQFASLADQNSKDRTITYYADGTDGKDNIDNVTRYPITGYVIRKYVHPIDAWGGNQARVAGKSYPIIRYAEILLAYAEALNQLTEDFVVNVDGVPQVFSRNPDEIRWAFNQVRYRAGVPGLVEAEMYDAGKILEKIKRERMVEFLYENQRYFDVRRWGDYEISESEPIKGMNTAAGKTGYYQRVTPASVRIGNRVVERKMIFLPIPKSEVKRLPMFDQNPGW